MAQPPHAPSRLLASFHGSYRELLRYLTRRTGCADVAGDVAHDTWLRVAELARQGREPLLAGEGDARGYLFTMARNMAIDRQRHEGVALRHALLAYDSAPGMQAAAPDASEVAMYRQAVSAVEQALAALPERARQVFLRSRVHGEDQGALALEYGVSRNTIERDMTQALDRVQAAMERWHAGQGARTGAAVPARTGRRRALSALLGAAGLGVGGAGGWLWWRAALAPWRQEWASAFGPAQRHALPDGSAVTLDAHSRVQVAYGAAHRSVRLLAGAAFFEVAPDTARRFEVAVPQDPSAAGPQPGVRITVLGTRFGVERLPGGRVDVQVESGRVRVELLDAQGHAGAPHDLAPGEAARFDPQAPPGQAPLALRLRSPQEAARWRHGLLAFDDAPLGETVERLRRYLPQPVEVDPAAAALRLSGQVRTAEAEAFLRALPGSIPVRAQWTEHGWHLQKI